MTHVEGRCKCGKLVKANVSRVEATVDETVCDRLRLGMESIYLQNTGEVFHSLFHELAAELELTACIAPLVLGSALPSPPKRGAPASPRSPRNSPAAAATQVPSSPPPRRLAKVTLQHQLRQILSVVNALLDVIAMPTASPSSRNACKGMVLALCRSAYAGVLRPAPVTADGSNAFALVEQQVQVKNLWKDFSRWSDVDKALRSPITLDSEALHMAHSFLLQRLINLDGEYKWAAEIVCPGIPQIANRWLNEALLGGEVRPEEVLLVAVSRFPVKEIANLSPETAQSFVMLPIQKALEFYAEQGYYRLALVLSKMLVSVAQYFPMLLAKCLAILTQCPQQFLPVCSSFLAELPWSVAVEDDLEDLLGALLGVIPALKASEFAKLHQLERMQYRLAMVTRLLSLQQELIALEHSLSFRAARFSTLASLAALFERFPDDHAFSTLIVQEFLFFSLHRMRANNGLPAGLTKSLQTEAHGLFEKLVSRVPMAHVGSALIETVFADLESQNVDAESIAALMQLPCFRNWIPGVADMKQLAFLTDHRTLELHAAPGADRIDAYIEQLFLGAPNVNLPQDSRAWATRNGGQIVMGVYWSRCPYVTQICAAFELISSRFVGMPSGWVVETMLSEKMSLFGEILDSMVDADLAAAERVLHIKCPHPLIEVEWRVLKMLIALHLTSLHCFEIQSASGSGVFAKFDFGWLESMGIITKMMALLPELTLFSASRLVARTVQVMVHGGKSSTWVAAVPLMDTLLQLPNIGPVAEKFVFSASVAEAARANDPYEGDDAPSLLTKTLQFWGECLGALSQKGYHDAVIFLENVLHSAAAAGRMHWPVLPGATLDAALVWARSGKHFLAIAVAASLRPIYMEPVTPTCAIGALVDMAVNSIQDKGLALLCWDVIYGLVSPTFTFPQDFALRTAASCATIEKVFPLGNPARKAFALIAESLNKNRTLPPTPIMADGSLRRFIWGKFPPAYKIASRTDKVQVQPIVGGLAVTAAAEPTGIVSAVKEPKLPDLPPQFLSSIVGSFAFGNSSAVEYTCKAAQEVSASMLKMEALEKDFIEACRGMYQVVSSKAVVSCGPLCKGGVEVSYDTMSQTAESLQGPLRNRDAFIGACSTLWTGAAKLAFATFLLCHCTFTDETVAAEVLRRLVAFGAEKLFPDHRPLSRAAKEALRVCGGPSVDLSLSLIRAFFDGCRERFLAEENGSVAQELHGDTQLPRLDFLLGLIVPESRWVANSANALALLEVARLVFKSSEIVSQAESRRLLAAVGFEKALDFLIKTDDCVAPFLGLICHMLAAPEVSVIVMNRLSDRSFANAVAVAVAATELWSAGCVRDIQFQEWKVALSAEDMSIAPPAWQPSWFDWVCDKKGAFDQPEVAPTILKTFVRALSCRRKPAGLIVSVRRVLPLLMSHSSWSDVDHVLRLCAMTSEAALVETAQLIGKCAPDMDAAVVAWLSWFSNHLCASLPDEGVSRVLGGLAPLWSKVAWTSLKPETILLFLKEVSRVGCTSQKRRSFFESWELFKKEHSTETFSGDQVLPIMLLSFVRGIWTGSAAETEALAEKCNWATVTDAHVEILTAKGLLPEMLGNFIAAFKAASGKQDMDCVLTMLESLRDGCLDSESHALSLFWMHAAALIRASVPVVLRVIVPLCRKDKSPAACTILVDVCSKSRDEDAEKLKSVLQTFVSSLSDPQLCLMMLKTIPAQILNPKVTAPLTEGLLHSYLACARDDNALEIAARAWTPPSLPENARNEFPIHDVASTSSSGVGLGLTLMLILERQRLVSPMPDQAPSLWAVCFASPSLASLYVFPADPVRPFDLVGLWVWALQSVIQPFRPNKHQEVSRVIIDFISQLDDMWLGYNAHGLLPAFLKDRMELAAGVCAMLAVRLTVETVSGDIKAAGVTERCDQLKARAKQLNATELSASLEKPLPDVCTALFQSLFPMGAYLTRVIARTPPRLPPVEAPPNGRASRAVPPSRVSEAATPPARTSGMSDAAK